MTRNFVLFLFVVATIFTVSCSKAPDGMPKTWSCTIKVIRDSAPVEGANITLFPDNPVADLISSGITDASGNAKIVSLYKNYQAKGTPEGSYKVVITKLPFLEHTKTPQEIALMSPGDQIAYEKDFRAKRDVLPKIVPDALTNEADTPLKVEVTTSGGMLEVDLSKYF